MIEGPGSNLFKDLERYKRIKRYDVFKSKNDERLNNGFDYREVLFQNSLSKHIFRNVLVSYFVDFLTDYFTNIIEHVKYFDNFKNFTVKSGDKNRR